jgi:cytochrome c-type biogenesis protein CcmH
MGLPNSISSLRERRAVLIRFRAGLLGAVALLAALAGAPASVSAQSQPEENPELVAIPLTAEQEDRYRGMIHELRCLVCQNQNIADSNAPLAADLRNQVRRQLAAGKSESEIRGYLTDRYGDFVLYRPPFKFRTLLLWAGPALLLLAGLVAALRYSHRRRPVPASVDQDALRRLLNEEP